MKRALKRDPKNSEAKKYLALAKDELSVKKDPQAASRYYNQGLVSYAAGNVDEAVRLWERCLKADPKHERAKRSLEKVRKEISGKK